MSKKLVLTMLLTLVMMLGIVTVANAAGTESLTVSMPKFEEVTNNPPEDQSSNSYEVKVYIDEFRSETITYTHISAEGISSEKEVTFNSSADGKFTMTWGETIVIPGLTANSGNFRVDEPGNGYKAPFSFGDLGDNTRFTGTTTKAITATYTPTTVNFSANFPYELSSSSSKAIRIYDSTVLPECEFSCPFYEFDGWEIGGEVYQPGVTVEFEIARNHICYAQWKSKGITMSDLKYTGGHYEMSCKGGVDDTWLEGFKVEFTDKVTKHEYWTDELLNYEVYRKDEEQPLDYTFISKVNDDGSLRLLVTSDCENTGTMVLKVSSKDQEILPGDPVTCEFTLSYTPHMHTMIQGGDRIVENMTLKPGDVIDICGNYTEHKNYNPDYKRVWLVKLSGVGDNYQPYPIIADTITYDQIKNIMTANNYTGTVQVIAGFTGTDAVSYNNVYSKYVTHLNAGFYIYLTLSDDATETPEQSLVFSLSKLPSAETIYVNEGDSFDLQASVEGALGAFNYIWSRTLRDQQASMMEHAHDDSGSVTSRSFQNASDDNHEGTYTVTATRTREIGETVETATFNVIVNSEFNITYQAENGNVIGNATVVEVNGDYLVLPAEGAVDIDWPEDTAYKGWVDASDESKIYAFGDKIEDVTGNMTFKLVKASDSLIIDTTGLTDDIGSITIPDGFTSVTNGYVKEVEKGAVISLDQFKFTSAKENGADKWIFNGWKSVSDNDAAITGNSITINGAVTIAPELYSNSVLYPTVGVLNRENMFAYDVWPGENAIAFKNLGDGEKDIKFWYRGNSTSYAPSDFTWTTNYSSYTESSNFPTSTETYTVIDDVYPQMCAKFTANNIAMSTEWSYLSAVKPGALEFIVHEGENVDSSDTFTARIKITPPVVGVNVDGNYAVTVGGTTTSVTIQSGEGTLSDIPTNNVVKITGLPGSAGYELSVSGEEGVTVEVTEEAASGTIPANKTTSRVKFTASKPTPTISFDQNSYEGVVSEALTMTVVTENIPEGAYYVWYKNSVGGIEKEGVGLTTYSIDSLKLAHGGNYWVTVYKDSSKTGSILTSGTVVLTVNSPAITVADDYTGNAGEKYVMTATIANMPEGGRVQWIRYYDEEITGTPAITTDADGNTIATLTFDSLAESDKGGYEVQVLSAAGEELTAKYINFEVNVLRSVTLNATRDTNTLPDDMVVYEVTLATDEAGTPVTLDKIIVDGEEASVTNGMFTVTKAHDQQVVISGIPDCTFFTAELVSSNDSHTYACSSTYYPVELWKDGFGWTYTSTCTKEMRTVTFVTTGGSTAFEPQQVREDKQITLPENQDAGFAGWQVTVGDSEILDQTYTAGQSVDIKEDTTFTAVWGATENPDPDYGMTVKINNVEVKGDAVDNLPVNKDITITVTPTGSIATYTISAKVDDDVLIDENGIFTYMPKEIGSHELTITATAPAAAQVLSLLDNGNGTYSTTITLKVVDNTTEPDPDDPDTPATPTTSGGKTTLDLDPETEDVPESKDIYVTGRLKDEEPEELTVYYVELVWGDLTFEWKNPADTVKNWDSTHHTYTETNDADDGSEWTLVNTGTIKGSLGEDGAGSVEGGQDNVIAFNHSNKPVYVTFEAQKTDAGTDAGITPLLADAALNVATPDSDSSTNTKIVYELPRGIADTIYDRSTTAAVQVKLENEKPDIDNLSEDGITAAKIIITLTEVDE